MISQAKLFDEKTSLVYQVESLKDELEDYFHEIEHLKAELHTHQSVRNEITVSVSGIMYHCVFITESIACQAHRRST